MVHRTVRQIRVKTLRQIIQEMTCTPDCHFQNYLS